MSKQITVIAGFLDEPRFGTTKNGKSYLQCSIPVKVETDRDQNGAPQHTTYRYSFTFWNQKADDFNTRGVLVKGQYVTVNGTVKMTAYINDHPKNPADKGKPGINIEFLPGFDLDLGLRPAGAPAVPAKVWQDNNNGPDGNNGGNAGGNNSGYNNNRQNNQSNNYNNSGNSGYNNNRGNNNNYNNAPPPAQPHQPVPQQDYGNQYMNNAPQSPYED